MLSSLFISLLPGIIILYVQNRLAMENGTECSVHLPSTPVLSNSHPSLNISHLYLVPHYTIHQNIQPLHPSLLIFIHTHFFYSLHSLLICLHNSICHSLTSSLPIPSKTCLLELCIPHLHG